MLLFAFAERVAILMAYPDTDKMSAHIINIIPSLLLITLPIVIDAIAHALPP